MEFEFICVTMNDNEASQTEHRRSDKQSILGWVCAP